MLVQEIEDSFGLQVCKKQSLVIERGLGVWVWDTAGEKYLDFTAGWGVTCLGHAHPLIVETISKQAALIIQNPNSGFTYSPARAELILELQKVLPDSLTRMFFANSGAEANDAALKLARKITGRSKVVSLHGSFHGRTLATLSVSGGPQNGARYLPRVPGQNFCLHNNGAELGDHVDDSVAAVILELVQGEGGVRAMDASFVKQVRALCDRHGCLMIIDEVQTGFCRTGRFFATDYYDVQPDILTMGKGIAGGLAFAALAMSEHVASAVELGDHGGTYCGNPLSCAVAAGVTRYLREHNIAAQVSGLGALAIEDLLELQQQFPDMIRQVRGRGLMLALELHSDDMVWPLTDSCQQKGLLVTPTRNAVVRLLPSLLLTEREWSIGVQRLASALSALQVDRASLAA
ncbi:MAG: aspartate aminotransferase family protein [Pseudohongiella sp.]|nr:aspartate aminotransferase family protein [Pseudohongiella sp.]